MKAITIMQPYASLVASGAKQIETRCWSTNYRGPIAIHAGKKWTADQQELIKRDPFLSALFSGNKKMSIKKRYQLLPFGAVIAIAELVDCVRMVEQTTQIVTGKVIESKLENGQIILGNELVFGNYETGYYAWILENVRPIDPVPAKGQQRIWNWEGNK